MKQCYYHILMAIQIATFLLCSQYAFAQPQSNQRTNVIGGVEMGDLTNFLFVFTDGNVDLSWQFNTKGYVGDVAVDGVQASIRTSGNGAYSGTIFTNDNTLGAWSNIVDQNNPGQVNPAQAFSAVNETERIADLERDLDTAFAQINALAVTPGYSGINPTSLDGLNSQNDIPETFVFDVTTGFSVNSLINITGDKDDVYIFRWDSDGNPANGYQTQVQFRNGGAIVPHGELAPSNFIHVAGEIGSSGGGTNPPYPYPQGPRHNSGNGDLITNGVNFDGGGFYTGYWLTTGDPVSRENTSLSNAIFVGGWYTSTVKVTLTSGTSGVHVPAMPVSTGVSYDILKEAANYVVLGMEGGAMTINSGTNVTGDFGYSSGVASLVNQKVGDTGPFTGTVYVHSNIDTFNYSANFLPSGGIVSNDTAEDSRLDQANIDALAASAYFSSLPADVVYGALGDNDDVVVTRQGAVTVIEVASVNHKDDLIELTGIAGADDAFVINVLGDFTLSGTEVVLVNVRPEMVIFNFPDSSDILIHKASTVFNGTILAPSGNVVYHNPAVFNGAIIAHEIYLHSAFNINHKPLEISTVVEANEYYTFQWNYGGQTGFTWDITNGEASVVRTANLTGVKKDTVVMDITLSNPDGVNIDEANCGVASNRIYTATCDADFAGSACGAAYTNLGCGLLTLGMTPEDHDDNVSISFTFEEPVGFRDLTIGDIDFNQLGSDTATWHDCIEITAFNNNLPVPIHCTFVGEAVLVSGNGTPDFKAFSRVVPDVDGDLPTGSKKGMLTVSASGMVDELTISMKNGKGDDGLSEGLGVSISNFEIITGHPDKIPGAARDTFNTLAGTSVIGNLYNDNGFGIDFQGDLPLAAITQTQAPSNGACSISLDGSFTYTPNAGFVGNDEFVYEITDANGDKDTAACTIYVLYNIDRDRTGDMKDIDDDDDGILDIVEVCNDVTPVTPADFEVNVRTNGEPFEISWELRDPDGDLVYTSDFGDYKIPGNPYKKNLDVIMKGAYRFMIKDMKGDGLVSTENRSGDGGFDVKVDGIELVTGIANFGHKKVYEVLIADRVFTCTDGDPSDDNDQDGIVNYRDSDWCVLNANGVCASMDTDGDGVPDYLDLDSDNDGIPDNVEAQPTQGFIAASVIDEDKDGLDDAYDIDLEGARLASAGITPVDTDGDGTYDYLDLDSDDDGVLDEDESGLTKALADADTDGFDDGIDITSNYRVPNGLISNPAFLPDEDGDITMYGGDVDYRDRMGGPLPVELTFFTAEADGKNSIVSWETASEINNDYFSVQRSTDALTWEEIAIVEGHGNSTEVHKYTYIDRNIPSGRFYYRLQQFDFDGTHEYSDVKSIEIKGGETTVVDPVSYFPIPTHKHGTLTFQGLTNDRMEIYLHALNGSLALKTTIIGTSVFDLSPYDLDAGMYIMDVIQADVIYGLKLILYE